MRIKIPLMNTTGNFTNAEIIIMVLGILVGAEEKINPSDEKQNPARIIPSTKTRG